MSCRVVPSCVAKFHVNDKQRNTCCNWMLNPTKHWQTLLSTSAYTWDASFTLSRGKAKIDDCQLPDWYDMSVNRFTCTNGYICHNFPGRRVYCVSADRILEDKTGYYVSPEGITNKEWYIRFPSPEYLSRTPQKCSPVLDTKTPRRRNPIREETDIVFRIRQLMWLIIRM